MFKIKPSNILDNRYQIKKFIAKGSMASVYRVEDLIDKKIVAIKIPLPEYDKELSSLQRFQQAEKIGKMLDHQNIVKVYDHKTEKSTPYIVMEFVDGLPLDYIIETARRLELKDVVNYTIQLCDALDYLRQHNIIHNDLKPHNVLISNKDEVKIIDFGVAFSEELKAEIWASLCSVGGTPAYMAPEKLKKHSLTDFRSDIFSVGVIVYEMLTGRLPFNGKKIEEILEAQIHQDYLSPSVLNPQIPPSIEKIIIKALAPDPNDRYQDALGLKEDLIKAMASAQKRIKLPQHILPTDFVIPIPILLIILIIVICLAIFLIIYLNKNFLI